jgi:hypothetical protein
VDVEQASSSIDALIDKRAAERGAANLEEMAWKASVRRHHEKLRWQRKGEWFCCFSGLADSLRASADHYERRALELLEDDKEDKHA